MTWAEIYLLCFAVGVLWSAASLLLGGMHFGHAGSAHLGGAHLSHAHLGSGHGAHSHGILSGRLGGMVNPSCLAIFLAWFGGLGYLLTRHSGLAFWLNMTLAFAMGLGGAWLLASFLRFLQAREQPLDPSDYEMVGVLGSVSSRIRPDGFGEVVYIRDGARKSVAACSEDKMEIAPGHEVIVLRYEKGIAYVRTWEALTQ